MSDVAPSQGPPRRVATAVPAFGDRRVRGETGVMRMRFGDGDEQAFFTRRDQLAEQFATWLAGQPSTQRP